MSEGSERTAELTILAEPADPVHSWPQDSRERGDFYHRPRVFPDGVRQWRDVFVRQVAENPARFPGVPRNLSLDEKRTRIDDGLARLREITRILELLYGTPSLGRRSNSPDKPRAILPMDTHASRVLCRLGIFSELGVRLDGQDRKHLQEVLPNLVPPALRQSLHTNLVVHGREVCTNVAPDCQSCELRNLCQMYRKTQVAAARSSKRRV